MGRLSSAIKYYSWYYPTVIGVVLIVGVLSTAYTYVKVTESAKRSLLEHVSAVANALEPHHIVTLAGNESDLSNEDYIILKERLEKIRVMSHDVRFIYLTGFRDGNPFFLADSEPEDSEDYSPPGQVYEEASPIFRSVFLSKEPIVEGIFSDRWGTWLTALSPIIDPDNDEVVAVLGMDMNARIYYQMVYVYSALPAVVAGFVILLFVIGYTIRKREQKFLEFKSELVSIASHEIRTPLTGISWITEGLLRKSGNMAQDQKNDIELIKSHSRNLLSTINDLLDLSAVEKIGTKKLNKQEIAMLSFLQKLAENFQLSLEEKSLKLIFDGSLSSGISVLGDEDRLKRMFNNLISNAIKYSKDGGIITIGCNLEDKRATIWIKDQGIGIPQKDQPKIFDGFYRSENAKQAVEGGTGLGLRYVRQIVQLHDGRVWCESEENKGSTFFVELPV